MIEAARFPYWRVVAMNPTGNQTIWTYKRIYKSENAARTAAQGMTTAKHTPHAVTIKQGPSQRITIATVYRP